LSPSLTSVCTGVCCVERNKRDTESSEVEEDGGCEMQHQQTCSHFLVHEFIFRSHWETCKLWFNKTLLGIKHVDFVLDSTEILSFSAFISGTENLSTSLQILLSFACPEAL
jgi:hypothetical protein